MTNPFHCSENPCGNLKSKKKKKKIERCRSARRLRSKEREEREIEEWFQEEREWQNERSFLGRIRGCQDRRSHLLMLC